MRDKIEIIVAPEYSEFDILKSIGKLAIVGGFEIDIRKAVGKNELEYWFLEHVFQNNRGYFAAWRTRFYNDLGLFVKKQKLFPIQPEQYEAFRDFFEPYRKALVYNVTGWNVDQSELKKLADAGLVDSGIMNYPELAYRFGMMFDFISTHKDQWMDRDKYFRFLAEKAKEMELSRIHKEAVRSLQNRANGFLSATANNMFNGAVKTLYREEAEVLNRVATGVQRREHAFVLGRHLRDELEKIGFMRDYDRVARTELVNAFNQGHWDEMTRKIIDEGGKPEYELVYRIPSATCCKKCFELYMHRDGSPKLYTYKYIAANLDNHGRSPDNWVACIGATHPNCRCSPIYRAVRSVTDLSYPNIFNHPPVA